MLYHKTLSLLFVRKKNIFFISANLKYFREVYEQMKHRVKRSLEYSQKLMSFFYDLPQRLETQ